jgi:hypothetical protein
MRIGLRFSAIYMAILAITSCNKNEIELIPGTNFDEYRSGAYYQEYDVQLGDRMVEGVINIDNLENRIDDEGIPVMELSLRLETVHYQDDTLEIIEPITLPAEYSIAVNIETGYYALKGLPEIEDGYEIVVYVEDHFWNLPDHERYSVTEKYTSSEWNDKTVSPALPTVTYYPEDPSIIVTIKLNYMVDQYWVENSTFENDAVEGTYTSMSYAQLAAIASIGNGTDMGDVGLSKGDITPYGVHYVAGRELWATDCQTQEIALSGIAGGRYWHMSANIYCNGAFIGGYYDFHASPGGNLVLNSGDSYTGTIDIYIPSGDLLE